MVKDPLAGDPNSRLGYGPACPFLIRELPDLQRPNFGADRNVTLVEFRQHDDDLMRWIRSWQFKPSDRRPYFTAVRTLE